MTYRIGIRNSGGAPDAAPGLGSLAGSPREQSDVQDELATELGHARAASSFFTRLCYVARMTPSGVHAVNWRGEAWCAKQWQQHIRPGGFGEVQFYAGLVQFLLEMDLGTEDRGRTEAKMERYRVLARGMTASTRVR